MKRGILIVIVGAVVLTGCAAYTAQPAGDIMVDRVQIRTTLAWNVAPRVSTQNLRPNAKVWTQDGLLLNRLMIIPAVPDGEAIFIRQTKQAQLPVFRADMLPNEIEELTESSILKLFGEGEVAVEATNLRPHDFSGRQGFLFDLDVNLSDGPDYGGTVGAIVFRKQLYLICFLAARPYYHEKLKDEALMIIRGARI